MPTLPSTPPEEHLPETARSGAEGGPSGDPPEARVEVRQAVRDSRGGSAPGGAPKSPSAEETDAAVADRPTPRVDRAEAYKRLLRRMHPVRRLLHLFYIHLVKPVVESRAPLGDVAWGATMGMLIGMTPTMGIQLWITTFVWVVSRYLLRFRFNLTVAMGIVWISNPITVVPLYYLFLVTGDWMLGWWAEMPARDGYAGFAEMVHNCCDAVPGTLMHQLWEAAGFLLVEFGWPILVGSLLWAVPLAVLTFPVTYFGLRKYRALQDS